jgi:NADPH-dependent curcumin reductase CurA
MPVMTRRWVLARRADGRLADDLFDAVEEPLPTPDDGQFLLEVLWVGTDPGLIRRLRLEDNYAPPIGVGDTIYSHAVGRVIDSKHPDVAVGKLFSGSFGWAEHSLRDSTRGLLDVDPSRPLSAALGILGLHGLTARIGIVDIAQVQSGETVVISAAAGAIGLLVGQLAKIRGCRTVGIVGSRRKASVLVDQYGFDAAVSYRDESVQEAIRETCPGGVDVYFDNVGGDLQDAIVPQLRVFGRFIICGRIALADLASTALDTGIRDYNTVLTKRLRKQGFLVYDHLDRLSEVGEELWTLHQQGLLALPENVLEGFESIPSAFAGLLRGDNIGRQLVHLTRRATDDAAGGRVHA